MKRLLLRGIATIRRRLELSADENSVAPSPFQEKPVNSTFTGFFIAKNMPFDPYKYPLQNLWPFISAYFFLSQIVSLPFLRWSHQSLLDVLQGNFKS